MINSMKNIRNLFVLLFYSFVAIGLNKGATASTLAENEVPIFITLGQSNADGWGAAWNFDYDELELYKDERFPNRMG
ncbi:MAG: hypothetical protein ACRC37_07110, partial [Lentisphaeria bacterium]